MVQRLARRPFTPQTRVRLSLSLPIALTMRRTMKQASPREGPRNPVERPKGLSGPQVEALKRSRLGTDRKQSSARQRRNLKYQIRALSMPDIAVLLG